MRPIKWIASKNAVIYAEGCLNVPENGTKEGIIDAIRNAFPSVRAFNDIKWTECAT